MREDPAMDLAQHCGRAHFGGLRPGIKAAKREENQEVIRFVPNLGKVQVVARGVGCPGNSGECKDCEDNRGEGNLKVKAGQGAQE